MTSIYITTQFHGFHHWPDAPEEVAFLRSLHRHLFKVRVDIEVGHPDRQVEFFILKGFVDHVIQKWLLAQLKATPAMSCEMMAECLAKRLLAQYPSLLKVEVSEDGTNYPNPR